jgi:DNA topoisomerase-1
MAKKLVIVESPAKAKTIGGYLGNDYEVLASIGHIRDLMPNAKGLPDDLRKKWWSDYAVDVDNDFEPFYEVPAEKSAQVRKLREALKGKDTLVLATDEDREGEAISWHLLEVLKPAKNVKVQRIAFHEITREAIQRAIQSPREIDTHLVEAQETRRILDRLYGYTLSPVLWSRVMKNLSAGRVQSPAVKIIVEREIARRNFRQSVYWDLRAEFEADGARFAAKLDQVNGIRVANGSDFEDTTGTLHKDREGKVRWISESESAGLAEQGKAERPYRVTKLEETEGVERPAAPFMTTTLQQDANRKFGYAADRTMRIAQTLYEGVDLGGESVGLITYMRTDSLSLSEEAVRSIRSYIAAQYSDCLPARPPKYASKVKNAQEAHEAIRPSDVNRRPQDVARFLTDDQLRLYTLIWQRTVASQMKPSEVLRTEVEIEAFPEPAAAERQVLTFRASGKQVKFDGFRRVYEEGREDENSESGAVLPRLAEGKPVELAHLEPSQHETKPPARYTDASLIKKLEEMGIGRPSTYASIISVIVDRGYVRKQGRQLVPTFRAFFAFDVLDRNFQELMDLGFTARMDEVLDEISEGKANAKQYLREFFLGDSGLRTMVEERKQNIAYPNFHVGDHPETGEPIIVRNGRDGSPFLQVGDAANKKFADIPDELAPADLTLEKALELLERKAAPAESIGFDPTTGRRLILKFRQGYYLEVERTPEEIENKVKPTWVSLPSGVDPRALTQEDLNYVCDLPKRIGVHPELSVPIEFKLGKYGPYIECGEERRTVEDWRMGQDLDVDAAVELLKQPKGRPVRKAAGPLAEFGALEGAAGPVKVLSGRFGPYVTDGVINATLPRGTDPGTLTAEQALELLARKREANPDGVKAASAKAPAKKATTTKAGAKKAAPAKASAKKATSTKAKTTKTAKPKAPRKPKAEG